MASASPEKGSLITRIVDKFLDGNLSVILILVALVAGAAALMLTPREEEPQIEVPLADVYVHMPGASAKEVERLVATPLEKLLWQVDGVEYVYSTSRPDMAVVTVRYYVGEDRIASLVKLHNKIATHTDLVPPGVTGWVIKPVAVDDVPIVNFSLYSDKVSDFELRRVAEEVVDRLQSVKNTSVTTIIGGRPRQVRVTIDPQALAAHQLSPLQLKQALAGANLELPAGSFDRHDREILVRGGSFFRSADEVADLMVGVYHGKPVYLRDVAKSSTVRRKQPPTPGCASAPPAMPSWRRKARSSRRSTSPSPRRRGPTPWWWPGT